MVPLMPLHALRLASPAACRAYGHRWAEYRRAAEGTAMMGHLTRVMGRATRRVPGTRGTTVAPCPLSLATTRWGPLRAYTQVCHNARLPHPVRRLRAAHHLSSPAAPGSMGGEASWAAV